MQRDVCKVNHSLESGIEMPTRLSQRKKASRQRYHSPASYVPLECLFISSILLSRILPRFGVTRASSLQKRIVNVTLV